jgi:hypothetical protein
MPVGGVAFEPPVKERRLAVLAPMLHAVIEPEAVPEFDISKVHRKGAVPAVAQVGVAPTDTFAVLPSDENRPNAKPAMATPATRVIAMRMTVARTGEIAFLFAYLPIFNVGCTWCRWILLITVVEDLSTLPNKSVGRRRRLHPFPSKQRINTSQRPSLQVSGQLNVRFYKKRGVAELFSTLLIIGVTLVAGVALIGFVYGQLGVASNTYGGAVVHNINYLNEREAIPLVNFASNASVTVWLQNVGSLSLASYTMVISGYVCSLSNPTCTGSQSTPFTLTCLQGNSTCKATFGTNCGTITNTFGVIPTKSNALQAFTIALPLCSFQKTSASNPTSAFTFTFIGQYGSSSTDLVTRWSRWTFVADVVEESRE